MMESLFSKARRIHFTGIKGVAMTALALYCRDRGILVSGSDVEGNFPTQSALDKSGIPVSMGFSADHIPPETDILVYTGAHGGRDNPEVVAAVAGHIPVFPHGKALGACMEGSCQISVAGSHGKTTTSAFVSYLLQELGYEPSYAVGAGIILPDLSPGRFGKGRYFVAEADEYMTDPGHDPTPRFAWQHPELLVVTNIDFDHPDAYRNLEEVESAFLGFAQKAKTVIISADDPKSRNVRESSGTRAVTFGRAKDADYRIDAVEFSEGQSVVSLSVGGASAGRFRLSIPGMHNAVNAAAAIAVCHTLGIGLQRILDAVPGFMGTLRRCQKLGERSGAIIYDDYAHHPAEIRATLAGLRAWYPSRRIMTVFQPHTYSRTKALLPQFATAFSDASEVFIADIYASAREHETLGIDARTLVGEIEKAGKPVWYCGGKDRALPLLLSKIREGDIVVFMGAGDIYEWGPAFIGEE